jgi:hypothetical protein
MKLIIRNYSDLWFICTLAFSILLLQSCKEKPTIPTVTTATVSQVSQTTAVSGGSISDNGGSKVTARGICWSISQNPETSSDKTEDGSGDGSFISSMSGLTPNTKFYVRAYATNSEGTAYGNEITFTSAAVLLPEIRTTVIKSITSTSAIAGGEVLSDGGGTIISRGVCWSTSTGPTVINNKTVESGELGEFLSDLSGLVPSTMYYIRAYATNSAGTSYGNEIIFSTKNQFDLNDYWQATDGHGIRINGTYGSFFSFSARWQEVSNSGLVSIGSESLRSIVQIDTFNWTCEVLWWLTTDYVYSTTWVSGSNIKMSDDGSSMDIISTSPIDPNDIRTKTFYRYPTKGTTNQSQNKYVTDQISGY